MLYIRRQRGRPPVITFFRFLRTLISCARGKHCSVEMDGDCFYCGLRAHKNGNTYPTWPLKARKFHEFKKIASLFYYWKYKKISWIDIVLMIYIMFVLINILSILQHK